MFSVPDCPLKFRIAIASRKKGLLSNAIYSTKLLQMRNSRLMHSRFYVSLTTLHLDLYSGLHFRRRIQRGIHEIDERWMGIPRFETWMEHRTPKLTTARDRFRYWAAGDGYRRVIIVHCMDPRAVIRINGAGQLGRFVEVGNHYPEMENKSKEKAGYICTHHHVYYMWTLRISKQYFGMKDSRISNIKLALSRTVSSGRKGATGHILAASKSQNADEFHPLDDNIWTYFWDVAFNGRVLNHFTKQGRYSGDID